MEVTISKHSVEVYKIRGAKLGGWADITIDANGKTGRISISSSHGDWAHYWGACGCGFKDFLCGLNIGYVAGKFGCASVFDFEETIKGWKQSVLEYRKTGSCSAEYARKVFNEIKGIENDQPSKEYLYCMLHNSESLLDFFEGVPYFETIIDPAFVFFWNEIWPVLTSQLKQELQTAEVF